MSSKGMARTVAAAVLMASGMACLATPASAECRAVQTATASGLFKTTVGLEARAAWRLAVIARDGIAYALWSKAKSSSTRCHGKSGAWKCTARGRPCV